MDCFIAHQANKRIITATADRLGMPVEKVVINIDRFGNTTAGTIPIAMQTAWKKSKLKKGRSAVDGCRGRGIHLRGFIDALGILDIAPDASHECRHVRRRPQLLNLKPSVRLFSAILHNASIIFRGPD